MLANIKLSLPFPRKVGFYEFREVRTIIFDYINSNKLMDKKNKR